VTANDVGAFFVSIEGFRGPAFDFPVSFMARAEAPFMMDSIVGMAAVTWLRIVCAIVSSMDIVGLSERESKQTISGALGLSNEKSFRRGDDGRGDDGRGDDGRAKVGLCGRPRAGEDGLIALKNS
jgi:hypothetical protein